MGSCSSKNSNQNNEIVIDNNSDVLNIMLLGDANVGKTSIVNRYVHEDFTNFTVSNTATDIHTKVFIHDGQKVNLKIWDTAGQERFNPISERHFYRADGALVIFDITSHDSYTKVGNLINSFQKESKLNSKIILIGNKTDLEDSRRVNFGEASELAKSKDIPYIETSAMNGYNIDEAFETLVKECLTSDIEIRNTA